MATAGGDENDWQKLSPDQKVQHKAWKARMTGYEECVQVFRTQSSDESPEFTKYAHLMKKFVLDPNENAREKALDAIFAFVEEANIAGKIVNDVAAGLISKCLNGRSKMRERTFDICLMYIEIEKQVEIQEELIKGLEHKQPKIVQACLELLRKGLSDFGSKILPIKPFIKQVIPLLDDRDKAVRDESKLLIVEIYKWIGRQTLMPLIQNVQPIQMQELKTEFDKLDCDKPQQKRFLRSQQDLKERIAETMVTSSVMVEDTNMEMQEDLDPFDMIEAVNILERLSKDFFEKIESKQWKDRKDTLDDLLTLLTKHPKPTPESDYSELMKILRKIISKDSNIPVVLVAAKCLSALAKGLRQAFRNYAVGAIEVCLDRCREKKNNVIEALRETCENTYPRTNLEQLSEVTVGLLGHKTPIVRQCTQQFLTKCFAMATAATLPKKVFKIYLSALIKNTGEADPTVRDSAFESVGMLWKCLGEKHIQPNLTELDELKLNKIKEYADKAVLLNLRGEPRSTAPMIKAIVPEPVVAELKVVVKKSPVESTEPKPTIVVKKKPVPVAKPPTPTQEPRPPKPIVAPRLPPTRTKPPPPVVSSFTTKVVPTKPRPVTAPTTQSRSQRLVPIVLPSTTKARPKPVTATNRRSSFGAPVTPLTSNLERQSTSTGGSTSSISSTNTQGSNPPTRSETPTMPSTSSIFRSVSNDVLPSPNSLHLPSKSRIPVRTIPVAMTKKSST